ncbi:MAG TPA: hypothetical protein PLI27_01225 [Ignavibacteriales bacterium]|nr:hypothetical protein [Ignavibacteriales bacterium]HOL80310.1 hypothetical protein [Ignavibacteriales bacterium]HOM64589.1 hypothetical protein [Ignavibacteriales bacterium]HPD66686.1 hypothetical protein [Ignavibacteriales bacterium]HPP32499.1 hypothetical protein [Ignavibacteriales bacterium]
MNKFLKIIFLFSAAMLFLGIFNQPTVFYKYLRFIITVGALVGIYNEFDKNSYFWIISFLIIAVLFNPIFPVYL